MLRLPPFTYLRPKTLTEAIHLVADQGPDVTMLVAGGTDLYPNMKRRQFEPQQLVGLRHLAELQQLTGDDRQGLTIGAGITLANLGQHHQIMSRYPALATAIQLISTPQLRNMGTIGGNLCVDTRCNYYNQTYGWRQAIDFCMKKDGDTCWVAPGSSRCWAVSSSDTAPVMIALNAQVRLLSAQGERTIRVQDLYRNDGMNYLGKRNDEILTEIRVPPTDGLRMQYVKLRRRGAFDFPILGVAVGLQLDDDGTCLDARIVLGAVASAPLVATDATEILLGQRLTPDVIAAAADAACKPARPLDNTDLILSYRKKMVRVYVARTLRQLAGLPNQPVNGVEDA